MTALTRASRSRRRVESCALWQLRDQEPLGTWTKDRVILIGDAAHAMLPRASILLSCSSFRFARRSSRSSALADQGQGGGQAIEDAEALKVVLPLGTLASSIPERLKLAQEIRYERATLIQGCSRSKALGPRPGETVVNAQEHASFNFGYSGARAWAESHGIEL